jgi:hypothetical protein
MMAIKARITVRRETRPEKSESDRWEKRDQSTNSSLEKKILSPDETPFHSPFLT